ncbi:MAG: CheR family methyltransferase [Candidatus Nanopelagicales bacterium]
MTGWARRRRAEPQGYLPGQAGPAARPPRRLASRLKVFATDLDEPALTLARRGAYPPSSVERIPDDLRARYVVAGAHGPEIATSLRECTVFARHNLMEDPPFPRMDLVSVRNTLIYFTAGLQQRALHSIQYSLNPGGLLFLGGMESLPTDAVGFAVVDLVNRIYARTGEQAPNVVPAGGRSGSLPPTRSSPPPPNGWHCPATREPPSTWLCWNPWSGPGRVRKPVRSREPGGDPVGGPGPGRATPEVAGARRTDRAHG